LHLPEIGRDNVAPDLEISVFCRLDLPLVIRTSHLFEKSIDLKNDGHEKKQTLQRSDLCSSAVGDSGLPLKQNWRTNGFSVATFLPAVPQLSRYGSQRSHSAARTGNGEGQAHPSNRMHQTGIGSSTALIGSARLHCHMAYLFFFLLGIPFWLIPASWIFRSKLAAYPSNITWAALCFLAPFVIFTMGAISNSYVQHAFDSTASWPRSFGYFIVMVNLLAFFSPHFLQVMFYRLHTPSMTDSTR
jgi:hypothetical protein